MSEPHAASQLHGHRSAWLLAFLPRRTSWVLVGLLLCFLTPASAQRRGVWGVVTNSSGQTVPGAAVKLSNRVTLKIRSYITQADGKYRFRGLHPDMDYTVRALKDGNRSQARRLSHFTSSKLVRADLLINAGK
jgi:hypothetical protein